MPKEVTVYVDGRALDAVPEELSLEKDQPHTVFFKGGGYRSQMVVLESSEVDGKLRLEPAALCNEVAFVEMLPEVHMEPEVSEGPPPE